MDTMLASAASTMLGVQHPARASSDTGPRASAAKRRKTAPGPPVDEETSPRAVMSDRTASRLGLIAPRAIVPVSLEPLQEWEGFVTSIGPEVFSAQLVDLTSGDGSSDEAVDLLVSDVPEEDLPLLLEGGVFRLIIGYQRRDFGQKIRASKIVFRRMPAWSKRELTEAAERAARTVSEIIWE